jgi:PLP dependent protein
MSRSIKMNVEAIIKNLPPGVKLVAATKTRSADEVLAAFDAGITTFGENYVQEALPKIEEVAKLLAARGESRRPEWHLIGHLQKNKAKHAVGKFDLIQSLDSISLAETIDKFAAKNGKLMDCLVEVNAGTESQKTGAMIDEIVPLVLSCSKLQNVRIKGLMTMGPLTDHAEILRPHFVITRFFYEEVKAMKIENVDMKWLSMGMSGSWQLALEEGANMIRIGTALFGERQP